MCGIVGLIDKKNILKPNDNRIKKMTDAIAHRGPDAEGQWKYKNVALGHRRLSIIDLDPRSSQPMKSIDERYVISFNGEIYNYLELKSGLIAAGAEFRTSSDTEVIIEAYRHFGTDCVKMFNGMWAFCIFDKEENTLFFSRDRFGIKPLYYVNNDNYFSFSSEAKGIIAGFPEENIPNELAIYRYISGSINENVDEESYYKNIKIFPPAHSAIYDLSNNSLSFMEYWIVDEQLFFNKWIKGKNPITEFRKLFDSSVELRLRADVDVGACLSGGLDSSAIVGCASSKSGKKIHTFSSIYEDKECNEEEYIRAVNEMWKTNVHYIRPDDEEANFTEHIKNINYHHDGPAMGASLYSQYMVMKGVQGNVKVVLDGQGADEMFAGYIPYYSHHITDLINKGGFINKLKAIRIITIVNKEWPEIIGAVSTDQIVRLVGEDNSLLFQNKAQGINVQTRRSCPMFTNQFMNNVKEHFDRKDIRCKSALNTRLCNDVLSKSIPALLHNEDSNSMAFSIESRVPFLDYRIVEFAIALDGKYKIRGHWTKWIIRRALKDYLPEIVVKRKNKMGFPAPFSRWLRTGKSKDNLKEIIFSFSKRQIVPYDTIAFFYEKHISGECDMSDILFKFYSAELWLRTCEC
ncbi:MAG: asparagine synthase (glutamine-hydrolyzing) [Oscillospiraceae bacterium]|nr:asparagine synthase (glutamine-hydrolyzing) [Oscillospiraceae bacterium]